MVITKPLAQRHPQLFQLISYKKNADDLAECLRLDLGQDKQESFIAEIGRRSFICVEKLEEWTNPEEFVVPDWQAG